MAIWGPGGSLVGTPGVSRDFYRYDRLLIGQCHMLDYHGMFNGIPGISPAP